MINYNNKHAYNHIQSTTITNKQDGHLSKRNLYILYVSCFLVLYWIVLSRLVLKRLARQSTTIISIQDGHLSKRNDTYNIYNNIQSTTRTHKTIYAINIQQKYSNNHKQSYVYNDKHTRWAPVEEEHRVEPAVSIQDDSIQSIAIQEHTKHMISTITYVQSTTMINKQVGHLSKRSTVSSQPG